jgi:hypothetical protein
VLPLQWRLGAVIERSFKRLRAWDKNGIIGLVDAGRTDNVTGSRPSQRTRGYSGPRSVTLLLRHASGPGYLGVSLVYSTVIPGRY